MGLDKIRQEIDRTDAQLKDLFLERMDLSRQVAEEKIRTGSAVYAPEREQNILARRTEGTPEEYQPECRAFFQHIMGISRTYQYSRLAEQTEELKELPGKEGEAVIAFGCKSDSPGISASLDALFLAGIKTEEIHLKKDGNGEYFCQMRLKGDFSQNISRAAVLQILEENQNARLEKVR